jgi:hypothetical protein
LNFYSNDATQFKAGIWNNVNNHNLPEKPQHVKGSPTEPLIDAIPIDNVILSILHIIIGVWKFFDLLSL